MLDCNQFCGVTEIFIREQKSWYTWHTPCRPAGSPGGMMRSAKSRSQSDSPQGSRPLSVCFLFCTSGISGSHSLEGQTTTGATLLLLSVSQSGNMDEGGPGYAQQSDDHKHNCPPGQTHQISSLLAFLGCDGWRNCLRCLICTRNLLIFFNQRGIANFMDARRTCAHAHQKLCFCPMCDQGTCLFLVPHFLQRFRELVDDIVPHFRNWRPAVTHVCCTLKTTPGCWIP